MASDRYQIPCRIPLNVFKNYIYKVCPHCFKMGKSEATVDKKGCTWMGNRVNCGESTKYTALNLLFSREKAKTSYVK